MNITVIISRAIAEALTIIFLGATYLSVAWVYTRYISKQIDLFFLAWTIFCGIAVGQIYQRIRLFLQTSTDKTFIKGWYDPNQVLQSITEALIPVLSIDGIVQTIKRHLKSQLELNRVDIILARKKSASIISHYYFIDRQKEIMPIEHPLVEYLAETKALVLAQDMPPDLKDILKTDKLPLATQYLPFFSSQNLEAILLLGNKASEDPYDQKDLTLLETIKNQALVVLDRSQSYEKMKQDLSVEREKVQVASKDLEKTHRLTSLGILAGGLAHEIRNPMMVLSSQAQLYARTYAPFRSLAELALRAQTTARSLQGHMLLA